MQELVKTLEKVRQNLADGKYPNESAVKQQIIAPVFQGLGWDIIDPNQCKSEYSLPDGTKADFALFVDGEPNIIIEAKAVGKATDAEQQLFQYIWEAGVPYAVLTDGREWRIYLTSVPGRRMDRLVYNLNIQACTPQESAETLRRYLSLEKVTSGEAAQNARDDLEEKSNRQAAEQAIPKEWKELINRKESPIITTFLNETASKFKHPPDQDDVRKFLCNLVPEQSLTDGRADISAPAPEPSPDRGAKSSIKYTLFDKEYEAKNAIVAYVEIFQKLANRDSKFLGRFEPEFKGKKSSALSRNKRDFDNPKSVVSGWWLNARISNSDKIKRLTRACEIADIKFGTDLKISLPNA